MTTFGFVWHYNDVTWPSWCLNSPATCWLCRKIYEVNSGVNIYLHQNWLLLPFFFYELVWETFSTFTLDRVFSSLFRPTSKQHQSSALLPLCEGNPPVTGGFPSQRASNEESVSMSWRHHGIVPTCLTVVAFVPIVARAVVAAHSIRTRPTILTGATCALVSVCSQKLYRHYNDIT